jgi:hypothetical protein
MESNRSSKQGEILPILCHFSKRTGIQFYWVTSYSKNNLPILHSNSFGLSLVSLVFKNFFSDTYHSDRGVSVSHRQMKNLFSKAHNRFLKIT